MQRQSLQAIAVMLPRSEKLPLVNKFLYEYLFWKAHTHTHTHTHVMNVSWNKVYINRKYRPTIFQIEDYYVTQILTLHL